MNQAALRGVLNPGEQNMTRFGTSRRRRRNSWWENVQLRRQRARLDRERSVREMNEQVERETRHNAAPTPTWLLREGQLPVCQTQVTPEVANCTRDTDRAINEGPNIPTVCPYGERDADIHYLPISNYNSLVPGRPILFNFMTLPDECLGNEEIEIDQPHYVNHCIREKEHDHALDLTLRLEPTSEADTGIQLPALNTNSVSMFVVQKQGNHPV